MDIPLPIGRLRWIEQVRNDLATLAPFPDIGTIEALSARLAAHALLDTTPREMPGTTDRYRRQLIAGGSDDAYSCLLIAWPPGYCTPIHDHAGLWGIELVLDGVLEVREFTISGDLDEPQPLHRRTLMLGVGDAAAFADRRYAHRCRNLSSTRPALSMHIYGGVLDRYHSFHSDPRGRYRARPQHARVDATLPV
jgi:predicted metal-dependent enzyme (double-stranded beta helix superfamily)